MSEHLALYPGHQKMWDPDDNERNSGEVLEGASLRRQMTDTKLRAIHEFIICNLKATEALREYVSRYLTYITSTLGFAPLCHNSELTVVHITLCFENQV